MAEENQDAVWPIPIFHFLVKIGSVGDLSFQEALGLGTEYDITDYRASNSPISTVRMPGLKKQPEITLKKGMFIGKTNLLDYFAKVNTNTVPREEVIIHLLDEKDKPVLVWTLMNAFPRKMSGISFDAKKDETAIEELVLACEELKMAK
jgi:phage tail-like protein